jgi:hypothetical protein
VLSDIPDHFAKIKQWIPEDEWIQFQERMEDCVEDETAWCTENTFLYYQKTEGRGTAHAVALYGQGHPEELLALFVGVFTQCDKDTFNMLFKLHPGKVVEEYLCLPTEISIKRMYQSNGEHPLAIRIDKIREKVLDIYRRQGLSG